MATVDLSRGNFRKRVTIKTVSKTADESKGHGESYSTLAQTWAVVVTRGGNRSFEEGSLYMVDLKDFYVTYRPAFSVIGVDSLINYEGKDYHIKNKSFVDEVKHILKLEAVG